MEHQAAQKEGMAKRILIYLLGIVILAVGINLAKLAGLGMSPVNSLSRALEVLTPFTLGQMIIIVFTFLVVVQVIIARKQFKLINALGIPVGIIFGWVVDLVGIDPNAVGHLMVNFPKPQSYLMQLVYLAASLLVIGLGTYTYLKPSLIPMPAEGVVYAITQVSSKSFGDGKTLVDCCCAGTALVLQLIFLGGLKSFAGDSVVVREGTIISAICIGQIVKLLRIVEAKNKARSARSFDSF